MNRKTFSAVLLAGTFLASGAGAGTITVSNGQSIQAAIDRAGAGDTVLVSPGTYSPFKITKDGITVQSSVPGGAHIVATGSGQPAVASYGQGNIAVLDFRITSKKGDGMKIGGSPGRMAKNITIEGNTIESAWLDGIKMFQADRVSVEGNDIKMSGAAGSAGKGANGNGDGGIDWVQVVNSEMIDNSVVSRGWACAMVKGGSGNNVISDNDFVQCEVNGLDMAAKTTGKAGAANKSGMIAFDSTVEGNSIDGGRGCAIKLGNATKNIKLASNDVGGSNCGGGSNYAGGENGGNYISTDAPPLLAGIGADVCSSAAMDLAASAVSIGSGLFSGGRATVAAQWAQNVQLIWANQCNASQNDKLATINEYERRNIANGTANNAAAIDALLQGISGPLSSGGFLMTEKAIRDETLKAYPNVFDTMTPDELVKLDNQTRQHERQAHVLSFQAQNRMIQEQINGVGRAKQYAAQGRQGEGIRSELQAANAISGEMVAAINLQTNATVAHQRAMAEVQLREETRKEAANKAAEQFMSTLTKCDDCKFSNPIGNN